MINLSGFFFPSRRKDPVQFRFGRHVRVCLHDYRAILRVPCVHPSTIGKQIAIVVEGKRSVDAGTKVRAFSVTASHTAPKLFLAPTTLFAHRRHRVCRQPFFVKVVSFPY